MRFPLPAIAAFVVLASPAGGVAAAATTPTPTSTADNDAAAKHARLTACLKDAKAKKLVGAQKSAFIKDCVAHR
jgi:hypothetical protein